MSSEPQWKRIEHIQSSVEDQELSQYGGYSSYTSRSIEDQVEMLTKILASMMVAMEDSKSEDINIIRDSVRSIL